MTSMDQIYLFFTIKNCDKDCQYKIELKDINNSLSNLKEFKTNWIPCQYEKGTVIFNETILLNFCFDLKQKIYIVTYKKMKVGSGYKADSYEHKTILSSLIGSKDCIYERPMDPLFPNKELVSIEVNKINFSNSNNFTVFDFLKVGIKLSTFIALDFSLGQKEKSNYQNNYIKIIENIVINLLNYKHNFYMYGYGATLNNSESNDILYKYIFNLNRKEDEAINAENIVPIYKKILNFINPEKKVYISSLIRKICKKIIEIYQLKYYNVLFVISNQLTEEEDKLETIDAFVESSYLPLSIIIICEEKNDYIKMNQLFGPKIKETRNKMTKFRNNIICFNYKDKFNGQEKKMIESSMKEIAQQIIEYYNLSNCTPEHIKKENIKNISNSINQIKNSFLLYESRMSQFFKKSTIYKHKNDSKENSPQLNYNDRNNYNNIINNNKNNINNNVPKNLKEAPIPKKEVIKLAGNTSNNEFGNNIYNKYQNKNYQNNRYENNNQQNNKNSNNNNYQRNNNVNNNNIPNNNYENNNSPIIRNNYQNNFNTYNNNKNINYKSNNIPIVNNNCQNNNNSYNIIRDSNNINLQNSNQKFTPGKSINNNNSNNNDSRREYYNNPYQGFKNTPGNSIDLNIDNNDQNQEKIFILTPGNSSVKKISHNPYQDNANKETPQGQFIIPQNSTSLYSKVMENPYNKDNSSQKKEENNTQSIRTINNNNTIINLNNSRKMNNYSIDSRNNFHN